GGGGMGGGAAPGGRGMAPSSLPRAASLSTAAVRSQEAREPAGLPIRVSYLHGRPGPHPLQRRLAESIGAEFRYVDFRMRWQDRDRSRLYTAASWLVCAAALPT